MKDRVLKTVSQVLNVPIELLSEESSPDTVASWDSLKHMNLILALEEEFGIQFRDEQIVEILKVGLIIEAVKELMAA
ncbi:MAG: acyl carrier protein [Deltaproteobacteria bacterium]|nr:acyl carrier protein [Deltaproteobacteria bacterium]